MIGTSRFHGCLVPAAERPCIFSEPGRYDRGWCFSTQISANPAPGSFPLVLNPELANSGTRASPKRLQLNQNYSTLRPAHHYAASAGTPKIVSTEERCHRAHYRGSVRRLFWLSPRDRFLWIRVRCRPDYDDGKRRYVFRPRACIRTWTRCWRSNWVMQIAHVSSLPTRSFLPAADRSRAGASHCFAGEDSDDAGQGDDAAGSQRRRFPSGGSDGVHYLIAAASRDHAECSGLVRLLDDMSFASAIIRCGAPPVGEFGQPLKPADIQHPPPQTGLHSVKQQAGIRCNRLLLDNVPQQRPTCYRSLARGSANRSCGS